MNCISKLNMFTNVYEIDTAISNISDSKEIDNIKSINNTIHPKKSLLYKILITNSLYFTCLHCKTRVSPCQIKCLHCNTHRCKL